MSLRNIGIVYRKELTEALRDKRKRGPGRYGQDRYLWRRDQIRICRGKHRELSEGISRRHGSEAAGSEFFAGKSAEAVSGKKRKPCVSGKAGRRNSGRHHRLCPDLDVPERSDASGD